MTTTLFTHARLLFVDDERPILRSLERIMRQQPYTCEFVDSGAEALEKLQDDNFDVVISDMKMPQMDGATLLKIVAEKYPETMRIVLSGFSEEDMVMSAINEGRIWGFIHKPWDETMLLTTINHALTAQQLIAERALLRRTLERYNQKVRSEFYDFVGTSAVMQNVYSTIERAAPSSASVFITGPSGTGKEVAAQAIHKASRRAKGAFIALNCAAIPADLLESEIFGHIKGAFSGAQSNRDGAATLADGGTLFLDELAEMDIILQAKLLRFIQTGQIQKVGSSKIETVDIRFICATNRPPLEAIAEGQLREDLYYRLNVVSIAMPSLAQRDSDAIILAEHFLQLYSQAENKQFSGFSNDAHLLLSRYAWPGNVRQLQNTIHRLVVLESGPLLTAKQLAEALQISDDTLAMLLNTDTQAANVLESTAALPVHSQPATQPAHSNSAQTASIRPLSEIEREVIEAAIDYFQGNVVKAASALEVSPSTLYRKIQNWEKSAQTA